MSLPPPRSTLFPYTTLFRSQENSITRFFAPSWWRLRGILRRSYDFASHQVQPTYSHVLELLQSEQQIAAELEKLETDARDEFSDRKSTRLNSSHANISYAVF